MTMSAFEGRGGRRKTDERGQTMAIVVGALAVLTLIPTAVQLLATGQAPISRTAVYVQQALEAARTGLSDYVNHLEVSSNGSQSYASFCSYTASSDYTAYPAGCASGYDSGNPAFARSPKDSHWAVVQQTTAAGDESFQYLVDNSQWLGNPSNPVTVQAIGKAGSALEPVYETLKATVTVPSTQSCVGPSCSGCQANCNGGGSFTIAASPSIVPSLPGSTTVTVTNTDMPGVGNGDTIDIHASQAQGSYTQGSFGGTPPATGSCILSAGSCSFVSDDSSYTGNAWYYGVDQQSDVDTVNQAQVLFESQSGCQVDCGSGNFEVAASPTQTNVGGSTTIEVTNSGMSGVKDGDTIQIYTSQSSGVYKATVMGPTTGTCVLSGGTCSFVSQDPSYEGLVYYFGVDTASAVATTNQAQVEFTGWACGTGQSIAVTLVGAQGGAQPFSGTGQGGGGYGAKVRFDAPAQSGTACVAVSGAGGAQGQFTWLSLLARGGPSSIGNLNLTGGRGGYTNFAGAASSTGGGGGGASALCLQLDDASGSSSCTGSTGTLPTCTWSGSAYTNMPCLLGVAGGGGGAGGSACVLSVCVVGGSGGYNSSTGGNGASGGNLCVAGDCLDLGLLTPASGGAAGGNSTTQGASGQTQTLSAYGGAGGGGGGGYPDGGGSGQPGGLLVLNLVGVTIAGGGGGGGAGASAISSAACPGASGPTTAASSDYLDSSGDGVVQVVEYTGACGSGSPVAPSEPIFQTVTQVPTP